MGKIFLILLFPLNVFSQMYFGRLSTTGNTLSTALFISAGESNARGLAYNSSATSPEKAKRKLQILNNTSLTGFDSLQIGVNNYIGQEPPGETTHGVELQLANMYDSGYWGNRQAYLIKTGHGGTQILHWYLNSYYSSVQPFNLLFQRIDSANNIIIRNTNVAPKKILLWSQGINDGGAGVADSTWKRKTKDFFTAVKAAYPDIIICMMRFDGLVDFYASSMAELATELTNIHVVSTAGLESIDCCHLSYSGFKEYVRRASVYWGL